MTFTRPANHRQLTFTEIAQSAKIPVNEVIGRAHRSDLIKALTDVIGDVDSPVGVLQVELLVMKALSVGLIKGNIDEVDQKVQMTWVQPRVLDLQQVGPLKCRCVQASLVLTRLSSSDQRDEGAFGLVVRRREGHGRAGGGAGPRHPHLNQFTSTRLQRPLRLHGDFSLVFRCLFCCYQPVNDIKVLCSGTGRFPADFVFNTFIDRFMKQHFQY